MCGARAPPAPRRAALWLRSRALEPGAGGLSLKGEALNRPPEGIEDILRQQVEDFLAGCSDPAAAHRALKKLALLGATIPSVLVRWLIQDTELSIDALMRQGWLVTRTSAREPQVALTYAPMRQLLLHSASQDEALRVL